MPTYATGERGLYGHVITCFYAAGEALLHAYCSKYHHIVFVWDFGERARK